MCCLFNFHSASATGGKKAAIDQGGAKGQQQVLAKENATIQHKKVTIIQKQSINQQWQKQHQQPGGKKQLAATKNAAFN